MSGWQDHGVGAMESAAPLRAVDHVESCQECGVLRVRARKRVHASDPYMAAHFPDCTVFPGVFILESLRQSVIAAIGVRDGVVPEIREIRRLKFLAPLVASDQLILDITAEDQPGNNPFDVVAECRRGDGIVAASLKVGFVYQRAAKHDAGGR